MGWTAGVATRWHVVSRNATALLAETARGEDRQGSIHFQGFMVLWGEGRAPGRVGADAEVEDLG
jgi:hypothetical protein